MPQDVINDPLTRLDYIREGGAVERLHTVPHIGSHRVDSHSWGVLTLILLFHPSPSIQLIKAAQFHDCAERFTGDTPAPAKWKFPKLKEALSDAEAYYENMLGIATDITAEEKVWLKACDMLDFLLYAREQLNMGNRHAMRVIMNATYALDNMTLPEPLQEIYLKVRQRIQLGDLRPINPEVGL